MHHGSIPIHIRAIFGALLLKARSPLPAMSARLRDPIFCFFMNPPALKCGNDLAGLHLHNQCSVFEVTEQLDERLFQRSGGMLLLHSR
jgi:hypothetical protein